MKEKIILIGINYKKQSHFEYSIEELKNLAIGLNYDVFDVVIQNVNKINPTYYVGKGKLEEIKQIIVRHDLDKVVFNNELSPSQVNHLEGYLECIVLDRTNLILDIFNERAKSKESQIQVEIARLQYMLPRLIDQSANLSRQRGGGVINRGSGEKKLETERRQIEQKIKSLKSDLETVILQRKTQRNLRQKNHMKVVSLVGYTNAGKSTILNTVMSLYHSSHKNVFEKNMLFATLDTSVRQIKLSNTKSFLLADTVGFIEQLPHHLINAFRSTLEEALESDLLIHVVDYHHPYYQKQMQVVMDTLKEIGIVDIPIITVYNKSDLVDTPLPKIEGNNLYISAKRQIGIKELLEKIDKKLFTDCISCKMLIPYDKMNLVNYFHQSADVNDTSYDNRGTLLSLICTKKDYEKYNQYVL